MVWLCLWLRSDGVCVDCTRLDCGSLSMGEVQETKEGLMERKALQLACRKYGLKCPLAREWRCKRCGYEWGGTFPEWIVNLPQKCRQCGAEGKYGHIVTTENGNLVD